MPVKIMAVCTGNIYRSALTEALLASALERRGLAAEVSSAGSGPRVGDPAPPELRRLAAARGWGVARLETHRARELDRALVGEADLILPLAREHLRAVVVADPSAFGRTFTLRELARIAADRPRTTGEPLDEWLARCHRGRSVHQYLRADAADDVSDPMGRSSRHLEAVATEIHEAVERVAAALAGA